MTKTKPQDKAKQRLFLAPNKHTINMVQVVMRKLV